MGQLHPSCQGSLGTTGGGKGVGALQDIELAAGRLKGLRILPEGWDDFFVDKYPYACLYIRMGSQHGCCYSSADTQAP